MGALADYVAKKFGVPCTSRYSPPAASVAALNSEVLLNDPDRLMWLLINLDPANTLYVYWEAVPAVPHGLLLGPGGGGVTFDAERHGELPGRKVLAGASGYPCSIFFVEIVGLK